MDDYASYDAMGLAELVRQGQVSASELLGEAVSRAKLVEDLGRDGGQAQERAVDVQITRLRRKIEADPKQPRYLQTVRGAGYMLAPD